MPSTATKPYPPKVEQEHWFFGSAYYLSKDRMSFLRDHCTKHDINWVTSRFLNIAVTNYPAYIQHVLVDNNKNYRKSFGYDKIKHLLGNGLITSDGAFWQRQRRLAQPAFHKKRLQVLTSVMAKHAERMAEKWHSYAKNKETVDISHDMMEIALEIVGEALFSSDVTDKVPIVDRNLTVANELGMQRVLNPFALPLWVPTPANIKEKKAIENLDEVVWHIIGKRRLTTEHYDDLLSMLMEARDEDSGESMTDQQLRDEVMNLFLAGHETSANALSWFWYLLTQYPEEEQKLRDEVNGVLAGRTPTFDDLPNMPYTKMAIREAMRLYPPAWFIGRMSMEQDEIGGYYIPPNTNVLISTFFTHRDSRWWDDPLTFEPERFTEANMKKRPKFAYLPFGGGPRQCIGNNFAMMEMQIIVPTLLQQFQLSLSDTAKIESDPLITLRPKHGMPMRVKHVHY